MNKFMKFSVYIVVLLFWSTHSLANKVLKTSRYSYIAFAVDGGTTVAGKLSIPSPVGGELPAVVIIHGSGGVDSRGPTYAERLNNLGVATLEIDMWSARGLSGGLDRPTHVRDTLPDAEAAFHYLSSRPEIDGDRIGLMGFSWGGVVGMLDATRSSSKYKSIASLYPVCWGYNKVPGYEFKRVNVKELLIISGTADQYDSPQDCEKLVSSLPDDDQQKVSELSLAGATHAFDRHGASVEFFDPYAFRGDGGKVKIEHNEEATKQSLTAVGEFFNRTLRPNSK